MRRRGPAALALLLIGAYCVSFTLFSISNLNKFSASGDLGAIWQSIYNLAFHGFPGSSLDCSVHYYWWCTRFKDFLQPVSPDLIGGNQLGIHFHALIFPLAVLARIFPTPFLLLVVQTGALGLAAWFFWKLVFELSRSAVMAACLLLCFLANPFLHGLNLTEFHFDCLAPLMIFGCAYSLERKNFTAFWTFAAMGLLAKESFSLIVLGLGALVFFGGGRENRRRGAIVMGVALTWFVFLTHWLMPRLSYFHVYLFSGIYGSKLGSTPFEILLSTIIHPHLFLRVLGTTENRSYLWLLFLSTGIWGVLRPRCLWICGALLFINLVSSNAAMKLVPGQYSAAVFPALYVGLAYFFSTYRPQWKNTTLLSISLAACLWSSRSDPFWSPGRWSLRLTAPAFATIIPAGASVSSSDRYVDFLADRWNCTFLPVNISQCDYVVIGAAGRPWYINEAVYADLRKYLDTEFVVAGRVEDALILRRRSTGSGPR